MKLALMIGLAYLIGAIPTSYLAAKHGAGIDLREHGSKNIGATNLYSRSRYPIAKLTGGSMACSETLTRTTT